MACEDTGHGKGGLYFSYKDFNPDGFVPNAQRAKAFRLAILVESKLTTRRRKSPTVACVFTGHGKGGLYFSYKDFNPDRLVPNARRTKSL